MEREVEEATTSSVPFTNTTAGEYRGGGGKFRKPFNRKPPSTPYARPSTTQTQQQSQDTPVGGWWFSKLVSPASRLITGSATKLFPSLFSTPTLPEVKQDDCGERPEEFPDINISKPAEVGQVLPQDAIHIGEPFRDISGNSSNGIGISEIEQMMKGKTFSRDDLIRLTELLQSRIVDQSDVDEHGQKNPDKNESAERECQRISVEERHEIAYQAFPSNNIVGEGLDHHLDTTVLNQVGASPVEIAKAHMRALTSESGHGSDGLMSKDERTPLPSTSKPSIFSPVSKTSICWPGVMVQEQNTYLTPQGQRSRVGLHNLPRTPYSRPVHSRPASKLQSCGDRSLNISSSQYKRSQVPIFGDNQVPRKRTTPLDDDLGSVGPIRRINRKFGDITSSRGMSPSRVSNSSPFGADRTDTPNRFSSMVKQTYEPGASTSSGIKFLPQTSTSNRAEAPNTSVGISTIRPISSDKARIISEHIDRMIPTPREKSEELKRATSWRKPPSSQLTMRSSLNDSLVEGSDSHKSNFMPPSRISDQGKEVQESFPSNVQPEHSKIDEVTGAVKTDTLAAKMISGDGGFGSGSVASIDFKKNLYVLGNTHKGHVGLGESSRSRKNPPLPQRNQIVGQEASRFLPNDICSEPRNVQKKPPRQTFGSKPALSSIFIGKPDPRQAASLDNGSGFTFPVSASSSALFEPPTPSIMPSSSPSCVPQKESDGVKAAGPSYKFGSKKTSPSLIFSFSSDSVSPSSDFSSPKYTFGSDKPRLSFRSVGEDAICS